MDDLVAFLRARYDEDEQAARWAIRESPLRERGIGEHWEAVRTGPEMRELVIQTKPQAFRPHRVIGGLDPLLDETIAAHIVRHDPMRVLADLDAKRRILDEHAIIHRQIGWLEDGEEDSAEIPACRTCVPKNSWFQRRQDVSEGPCLTVRLLALPHAGHEDYCEEWKPR